MLGERDPQGRLYSAMTMLGEETIEQMGFYGKLAVKGPQIFRDEDFGGAYCLDNGRPSFPPSILAMARILQHYEGISDFDVIQRTKFDLRWKVALHLDLASIKAPFSKTTFVVFRARLTLHEKECLAFEKSILEAKAAGLLPSKLRIALDSSPVRGRGAVKDTYNLLSDAIVGVLRSIAKERDQKVEDVAREAGLSRHVEEPSIKGSEDVEWNDPDSVRGFLAGLLADCRRAVVAAEGVEEAKEAVDLLRKIVADDVEEDAGDGKPGIRQGVAKDRTVSVQDPEIRHGRKSSGHRYDGHKAHIAAERTSGVITAVEVTAPGEADGSQVKTLVEQTEASTKADVQHAVGDCAYGSQTGVQQAKEAEVELATKMPGAPEGQFSAAHFKVSEDRQSAVCPAGNPSTNLHRSNEDLVHNWSPKICGPCPQKSQCTKGLGRSLRVPAYFHDRRAREAYARSPEGKEVLRERVVVEHAIARVKRLGAGASRYFGRAKTRAQWWWSAAVANLSLVWNKPKAAEACG